MPIARAADVLMRARPAHARPGDAVTRFFGIVTPLNGAIEPNRSMAGNAGTPSSEPSVRQKDVHMPGRVQEWGLEAMKRSEGATSGSSATLTSRLPE